MKKILFLITQSEFGGAQRFLVELISHLDPEKYKISIAAGEGNDELFQKIKNLKQEVSQQKSVRKKPEFKNLLIKTYKLAKLKRTPSPIDAVLSIFEIFNLLKEEKPDILFLCSTTAGVLGSVSSFFYKILTHANIQVIYRIGGWSFLDPRPIWINKTLFLAEKFTSFLKDKIIVNCENHREIAIKNNLCSPEKITTIYNGIDTKRLNFLPKGIAKKFILQRITITRPSFSKLSELSFVGTVANFYKTKGLEYLIRAVHILDTEYKLPHTKYIIIGNGKERKKLELLIKKYNLKNKISLLGRIPDAYRFLKGFDVFVLPSLKEGFPWIILEAMAAELPIIATKTGALPEIIKNGKEGILIEPKNSPVLAEKIYWILTHQQRAKNMASLAKKKLKKEFTSKKMIKKINELLA